MTVVMFDSIDLSQFPDNPEAVAGYVNGHWPTYAACVSEFPHALHLSIAVTAHARARCLDIETGDATPAQAPGWYRDLADRADGLPVLYTFASQVQAVISAMSSAGIPRGDYLLWSAHWTFREHICSPASCGYPQADATQWTDKAMGRNLDQSLCADHFFATQPAPEPPPPLPEDTVSVAAYVNENKNSEIIVHLESGEVKTLYKVSGDTPGAPGWKKRSNGEFAWESLGKPGK